MLTSKMRNTEINQKNFNNKIDWRSAILPLIIVLMSMLFYFVNNKFLSIYNFQNITRQVSVLAIIAVGQSLVIICGGIDLSQGSVMALSGLIAADFMVKYGMWQGILMGLVVGAFIGLISGTIYAKGKVPAFVVTLGGMTAIRGLTFLYTNGTPVVGLPAAFKFLGFGKTLGVPFPGAIAIMIFILAYLFSKWTRTGRYFYAIGGNEETAILSGINISKYKIISFVISGIMAAISGLILTARITSGQPTIGEGMALQAIAASVIGGISLKGGRGGITGTFFGVLILAIIGNGLNLMRVSSFTQMVVNGSIVIVAVFFDVYYKKD